MRSKRTRLPMLMLAAATLLLLLMAARCSGDPAAWRSIGGGTAIGVKVGYGPSAAIQLDELSATVAPPSWLAYKNMSSPVSVLLEGTSASGGAISQALSLPFTTPATRITAPAGGIACDFMASPDQQASYDGFVAAANPSQPEYATATVTFEDVRILAISSAVYRPYQTTVTFYSNGSQVGDTVITNSLSTGWSQYLKSAVNQVPPDAWLPKMVGKPGYEIEDYTYYSNVLVGNVITSMTNFSNQNATAANSNLLDAMSHLDGNPNKTQYITDPAARNNLYGIFQRVQLHLQHVATGVPETL